MKIRLVEITAHEDSWKGTWYRTGQRYFVRQERDWPDVMACRWDGGNGGIHDRHCREINGPIAWLRCLFVFAPRRAK